MADRISEFIDIVLLKAETRPIIAGMTSSPCKLCDVTYGASNRLAVSALATRTGSWRWGRKFLFESAVTH
jgi:hypothetical protein